MCEKPTPRYRHSADAFSRARRSIPGGVSRSVAYHPPHPVYLTSGDGAWVTDVDGNRYLDLNNNYTSLVLGHRAPGVVERVQEALERGGASMGGSTPAEAELAEHLLARTGGTGRIRFTTTGTEAAMFAVRIARSVTGRPLIVRVTGGYHGLSDTLVAMPRTPPPVGKDGIPAAVSSLTHLLPWGDTDAAQAFFAARGSEVAAVIVEPVLGSNGILPLPFDRLRALAELAKAHGALLVVDEIITFRLAVEGLARRAGIVPDITLLGKLIGGGFPLAAILGSERVMEAVDPETGGPVYHSGTFAAAPVSLAAGLATMDIYDRAAVDALNARGDAFRAELRARLDVERFTVTGAGSLFQIHVGGEPVEGPPGPERKAAFQPIYRALLDRGIFMTSRGMGALSTAISDAELERALEAFTAATVAS